MAQWCFVIPALLQHPSQLKQRIRDFAAKNHARDFRPAQAPTQAPGEVDEAEPMVHVHHPRLRPVSETPKVIEKEVAQADGDNHEMKGVGFESRFGQRPRTHEEAGEVSQRGDEAGVNHGRQADRPLLAFVRLQTPVSSVKAGEKGEGGRDNAAVDKRG